MDCLLGMMFQYFSSHLPTVQSHPKLESTSYFSTMHFTHARAFTVTLSYRLRFESEAALQCSIIFYCTCIASPLRKRLHEAKVRLIAIIVQFRLLRRKLKIIGAEHLFRASQTAFIYPKGFTAISGQTLEQRVIFCKQLVAI